MGLEKKINQKNTNQENENNINSGTSIKNNTQLQNTPENILKNNNSIIFNTNDNKNIKPDKHNYKDIKQYKPEGKLIYNDDLLKKLII